MAFYKKNTYSAGKIIALASIIGATLSSFLPLAKGNNLPLSPSYFLFETLSPATNTIIFTLLLLGLSLVVSLLVNLLSWNFLLIRHRSWLPFSFTLLALTSPLSLQLPLGDFLGCIIAYITILFASRLFQEQRVQSPLFFIGILWGIASLLNSVFLLSTPLWTIVLLFCRTNTIKNLLALLLGITFTAWNIWSLSWFFGLDPMGYFSLPRIVSFWDKSNTISVWMISFLGLFAFLWTVCFVPLQTMLHQSKIKTRGRLTMLYYLAPIFGICFFGIFSHATPLLLLGTLLFTVPLAHFFSYSTSLVKTISLYLLITIYTCTTVTYHLIH